MISGPLQIGHLVPFLMTSLLRMNALTFVCENLAAGGRVVYEASVDGTSPWVARCPVYTVHTSSIVQTPAVDAVVGACHHSPKGIVQTGCFCAKAVCLLWCLKSCFIGSLRLFLSFLFGAVSLI